MRKKIAVVLVISFLLNWSHIQTAQTVEGANGELFASLFTTVIVVSIIFAIFVLAVKVLRFVLLSARAAGRVIGGAPRPVADEAGQDAAPKPFAKVSTDKF